MRALASMVRRLRDDEVRVILAALGLVLIVFALALWLAPAGEDTTTVKETSTTSAASTGATEKVTSKTTTTTKPDGGPSDTILGILLGSGAILFLAGALWDRIQEIGLPGGASLKLGAARARAISLDDVAERLRQEAESALAAGDSVQLAQVSTSSSIHIVERTREMAATQTPVALVDLGEGDRWLLPNLYFLVWMLETWTRTSLIVFTKAEGNRRAVYVACATPGALREQLAVARPEFRSPTDQAAREASLSNAGVVFFGALTNSIQAEQQQAEPPLWVSDRVLIELAHDALVLESVELVCEDDLSSDELRAILCYTRGFVPITKKGRLVATVDKCRVSLELARPLVRAESAAAE